MKHSNLPDLKDLTAEQSAAITSDARRLAIVACPGSGKTSTLCQRVAKKIFDGVLTRQIHIVTFTVAAAKEFRERLEGLGVNTKALGYCGTIHGHALQTIRRHTEGPVGVISRELGDLMIKAIIENGNLKTTVPAVLKHLGNVRERTDHEIGAAIYRSQLKALGAEEVDMLIQSAADILCLNRVIEREPIHLFVDEYQDTSSADADYLDLLTTGLGQYGSSVTVVGDPDQAIYRFRGARPENFTDFMNETAEVLTLTRSFRLPKIVAEKASTLMGSAIVVGEHTPEGKITNRPCESPEDELAVLREIIEALKGEEYLNNEIAILCRYNRAVTSAKAICKAYGFEVNGDNRGSHDPLKAKAVAFADFMNKPTALARMEWNFHNTGRILALPKIDGQITPSLLFAAAVENGVNADAARWFDGVLLAVGGNIDAAVTAARVANATASEEKQDGGITVTTMHGAKGLEFRIVIMLGCEEMTIPGLNATPERVSEERRLFYVAMTRTQERLILTHCAQRAAHHSTELISTVPSQFMREAGIV